MFCNSTAPPAEVCGGIGQCIEDECVCPKGYAVLHNCEVTHYAVEPTAALVISCLFFFPPSMRWSRLQIFELLMIFFAYTRLWGTIHFIVNSQIGHERLWGSPVRELSSSLGLAAILIGMAMVVSLCYDMVVSVHNLDSNKTRTSRYVNWILFIGGVITTIAVIAGAIYGLFLKTRSVSVAYTAVAALYAIVFLVLGVYSVVFSWSLWDVPNTDKHRATFEFQRKVKIMICWNVTGSLYVIAAFFFNLSNHRESIYYFISFGVYLFIELTLGCLSLAFNQHYLYPFIGFGCCCSMVGVSSESLSHSRSSQTGDAKANQFEMNTSTQTVTTLNQSEEGPTSESLFGSYSVDLAERPTSEDVSSAGASQQMMGRASVGSENGEWSDGDGGASGSFSGSVSG